MSKKKARKKTVNSNNELTSSVIQNDDRHLKGGNMSNNYIETDCQLDPVIEAFVRNGAIIQEQVTMTSEEAKQYGVPEHERHKYFRLVTRHNPFVGHRGGR